MQTVETLNEGLKRAYRITISAKEIDALVDKELKSIAPHEAKSASARAARAQEMV